MAQTQMAQTPASEVTLTRPDGSSFIAYAAQPEGAARGVVVLHELLGRQPEVDRVVERFAAAGYAAIEPDLFHTGSRIGCIRQALITTARGEGPVAADIEGAKAWLSDVARIDPARIGVVGFCLGGGLALALGRHFAGVSSNYGVVPSDELLRDSGPIIACYGTRDRIFGRNGRRLRARLDRLPNPPELEVHEFEGVGHSFLTDGHQPVAHTLSWPLLQIRYNAAVAEEGWEKIMAFFERTL